MKNRRKCHAARRRANRLRREDAARADLARRADMMAAVRGSVPDAVDPAAEARDALSTKHAAKLRTIGCGCLAAATAILAALAWFAWK